MNVTVRMFAALREAAGADRLEVELAQGATFAHLLERLAEQYPRLAPWKPHVRIAANCEYVGLDAPVRPGDEIALIPPVSGG